jgi:hypothetical protein
MDAAFLNFEVQAAQDFLAAGNSGVKIVDNETHKMG